MKRRDEIVQQTVREFYREHGRHDLPWRQTTDPYLILVSEIMLQQTQVARVVPKYEAFIQRWSTVQTLAAASLKDVLIQWQGLGYNRRAKLLHQCAQVVTAEHKGVFPTTREGLRVLPGIGEYTSGAIMAFAYNQPVVLIETNVRSVVLHHYFSDQERVADSEIVPIIERLVDTNDPRLWYSALMDYGTFLKKQHPNPSRKSAHHTTQSTFAGSDRQIRGAIVRELTTAESGLTKSALNKTLADFDGDRVIQQLAALCAEGLVIKTGRRYGLPA